MSKSKKRKLAKEEPAKFPGEVDEVHPLPFITMPPQPNEKKPGQLSKKQLKQFFDEVCSFCFIQKASVGPCTL
jgi:hypothetical protein